MSAEGCNGLAGVSAVVLFDKGGRQAHCEAKDRFEGAGMRPLHRLIAHPGLRVAHILSDVKAKGQEFAPQPLPRNR